MKISDNNADDAPNPTGYETNGETNVGHQPQISTALRYWLIFAHTKPLRSETIDEPLFCGVFATFSNPITTLRNISFTAPFIDIIKGEPYLSLQP